MNLKEIKLPAAVIADLYAGTLIAEKNSAPTDTKTENIVDSPADNTDQQKKPAFLGNNNKYILVIVNNADSPFLLPEDHGLLINLLSACKLTLEDVAMLNISGMQQPAYKEIFSQFSTRIAIFFGTEPSSIGLPLNFPHFQVQPFHHSTLLSSPSLSALRDEPLLKSKLWVCLRRIFNV